MSLLSKVRTSVALNRKAQEVLYEMALDEFEAGDIRRGLWAQALAEADGDEARAKGFYLKLRVRAMQDDGAIMDAVLAADKRRATPVEATTAPSAVETTTPRSVERRAQSDDPEVGTGVVILIIAVALIAIYAMSNL